MKHSNGCVASFNQRNLEQIGGEITVLAWKEVKHSSMLPRLQYASPKTTQMVASASKKATALADLSPYIAQLDAKLETFPTVLAFEQVLRVKRTPMVAGIYLVSCVSGKSLSGWMDGWIDWLLLSLCLCAPKYHSLTLPTYLHMT